MLTEMRQNLRLVAAAAALFCTGSIFAQGNEWQDPKVNQVNRLPMHTSYFAYESANAAQKANEKSSANYYSLNGMWKFNCVRNADQRPLDFYKTTFNDKGWDDMAVPGIWEVNGYGDPLYVNARY